MEQRAGVEQGGWFTTRRVELIAESDLRPITMDCSLYQLQRDGYIEREATPGKGTRVRILR